MRTLAPWRAAAALLVALLPALAAAHLMPAGQGTLRVVGHEVNLVISLPVAALSGFDDDGDSRLSLAELNRHRDALQQQVSQRLDLRDGERPGTPLLADLLIPHLYDPNAPATTEHLIVMRRYQWPAPPARLTLRASAFSDAAPTLLLRAERDGESDLVALSALDPVHRFFAGPWPALQRFVLLGAEHILAGFDHLLFLLTVLAAGAGWRYWLAVVTSFTAAHSLTLTLSVLGWVSVPPAVAEPLIAASIVLMALDNLRQRQGGTARRAALVFGCGLVHGLGFATALQELGGTGSGRWLSLAGFNLGVELGQLLFVAVALGAAALWRRLRPLHDPARAVRFASIGAALVGAGVLAQRLMELA